MNNLVPLGQAVRLVNSLNVEVSNLIQINAHDRSSLLIGKVRQQKRR
jgi:hypothetical protein